MLRWTFALVVAGVLSGFAVLLVTGSYLNEGPVLIPLTRHHGLHAGDFFVACGWAVALICEAGLLRASQPSVRP